MKLLPLALLLFLSACSQYQNDVVGLKKGRIVMVYFQEREGGVGVIGEVVGKNSLGLQIHTTTKTLTFLPWTSIKSVILLPKEKQKEIREQYDMPEGTW